MCDGPRAIKPYFFSDIRENIVIAKAARLARVGAPIARGASVKPAPLLIVCVG